MHNKTAVLLQTKQSRRHNDQALGVYHTPQTRTIIRNAVLCQKGKNTPSDLTSIFFYLCSSSLSFKVISPGRHCSLAHGVKIISSIHRVKSTTNGKRLSTFRHRPLIFTRLSLSSATSLGKWDLRFQHHFSRSKLVPEHISVIIASHYSFTFHRSDSI